MPLDWRRVRRMFTAGIRFHTWRDTRRRVPIFSAPRSTSSGQAARTPSIGKISGHSVGDVCGMFTAVTDLTNKSQQNSAWRNHPTAEMALRKCSRKPSGDRSGFRVPATFRVAIPLVRVCRLRPWLQLESHRGFAALGVPGRNRILPCRARPGLDGSLGGQNFPRLHRRRTNA